MKHEENTSIYEADDGKMLVRISDGKIMGDGVDLGVNDTIENYEDMRYQVSKILKKLVADLPDPETDDGGDDK